MIKNPSETKSDLICEECGEPIKQNQIDNKPIYCEFCGALNNFVYTQKQETLNKRRKQAPKSQLEQKEIRFSYTTEELRQEIRNLAYQKIYELVKTTFSVMRRLKYQEDFKQSQILKLAKKLRKALLSLSLPSDSAELLTKTSKKKIENYFESFQSGLKKKKKNQSNYLPYFIKNIKFVFRLINGDYEFSNLSKYNQKAVKKLKEKYGFKINAKTKNSFSYSLSILMCRKIYRIITALGHVLDLKHSKNELTKQYTLNIAKDITALVMNNCFKRNFSKSYRKLKKDLEIDWVYRESFIEHVCSLIKLIYKLAYNKGYSSKLRGFQKLIAEDLKESAFFEDDTNFSLYLRLNLTLILSRIIHYVLDSSQNLTPLQSDPRKLNHTDNLRLATEILDELLADKKIKSEFLNKFYNLSLEEFQKEYENLQAKLKSDMLYKENFLSFLQKLINSVYKITHTRSKKSSHSKIELGIIKDLANYNFNWELIKKEKSWFCSEGIVLDNISKQNVFPYTTLQFVLDLKKEVSEILSRYISNETLSTEILNQKKSHIKSILEYSRKDPNYKLTGKLLKIWETELKSKFDINFNRLEKLIKTYKKSNKILENRHWVLYNHPDLKLDYFKSIDTLEKAYWFGLLFADGNIYFHKSKNRYGKLYDIYTISLQLSVNDGILIKRFINTIGFNPKHVNYEKKIVIDKETGEQRIIRTFRIRFSNELFAQNMINNGYIAGKKSGKIRLPKFENRNLYLAFLLGFFDGDGKQGTTRITTNSRLFLLDIKSLFRLKTKIHTYKYLNDAGKERRSFRLHLGADLFNEMLDNYNHSLPRKRVKLIDSKLAQQLMIPTRYSGPVKFKFSKEELKLLINKMSNLKIAALHEKRFGIKISPGTVKYWYNKWDIKRSSKNKN